MTAAIEAADLFGITQEVEEYMQRRKSVPIVYNVINALDKLGHLKDITLDAELSRLRARVAELERQRRVFYDAVCKLTYNLDVDMCPVCNREFACHAPDCTISNFTRELAALAATEPQE